MTETATSNNTAVAMTTAANLQELEETVTRISSGKGVEAVMILNHNGDIMVSSSGNSSNNNSNGSNTNDSGAVTPQQIQAQHLHHLLETSNKFMKSLPNATNNNNDASSDNSSEVSFIQIRSKQYEVMLAPHNDYVLSVLRNPLDFVVED